MDRERRYRKKCNKIQSIISIFILLVSIFIIFIYQWNNTHAAKILHKHPLKSQQLMEAGGKKKLYPNINTVKETDNKDINMAEEDAEIKIIFAGDTMFDWGLRPILDKHGYDYPFIHIKDKIQKSDYAFVNVETVFTEKSEKDPNQLFWIKSDVRGLHALKNAGFNMLNLGNNHTLDYLRSGLADTLQHVEQTGLDYIGIGRNEQEAYSSKEITIKGKKFRFFSFVRFIPTVDWLAHNDRSGVPNGYDIELVKKTILEQKGDADYTIVYFHWGIEKTNMPADYQHEYVKALKDIGVNLIVGSHPHWLQGFEYVEGMPVAYSLGNFLFPPYVKAETAQTGLLSVTFKGDHISMSFDPHVISNGQIIPVEAAARTEFLNYLQKISFNVNISDDGEIISN